MCGWLKASSILLRPLYDLMHRLLLQSKVIATDDTPVKVLDRKRKKNVKTGRQWVYRGDETRPFNLFDFTEGRGRAGPLYFLKGFSGYLQGGCFSGNLAISASTGATFVACRAHDRRYYIKAEGNYPQAREMLAMYADLFEIEGTIRDLKLSPEDTKQMRLEEAMPVLEKMKLWLDENAVSSGCARGVRPGNHLDSRIRNPAAFARCEPFAEKACEQIELGRIDCENARNQ